MKSDIKLTPVLSEKSYNLANALNMYTFYVDKGVSKIEIGKAVAQKYSVKVDGVNIVTRPGKMKRDYLHNKKRRDSDMRKAIVKLKSGEKIDEFFNI